MLVDAAHPLLAFANLMDAIPTFEPVDGTVSLVHVFPPSVVFVICGASVLSRRQTHPVWSLIKKIDSHEYAPEPKL